MRFNHPGAFPFAWKPQPVAGVEPPANPASVEPLTFTLKEAVELWWRLRGLRVTFAITATYAGDTRTFTQADAGVANFDAPRYTYTAGPDAPIADGSELLLCRPGQDAVWNATAGQQNGADFYANSSAFITPWGGGSIISVMAATAQMGLFTCASRDGGSLVVRRGTWTDDVQTVRPACDFNLTLGFNDGVANAAAVVMSNIPPAGAYDGTTSFTATIFGSPVTIHARWSENDYPGFTVDSLAMTVAKNAYFTYALPDGTAPVYDAATGAKLLDPLAV